MNLLYIANVTVSAGQHTFTFGRYVTKTYHIAYAKLNPQHVVVDPTHVPV